MKNTLYHDVIMETKYNSHKGVLKLEVLGRDQELPKVSRIDFSVGNI